MSVEVCSERMSERNGGCCSSLNGFEGREHQIGVGGCTWFLGGGGGGLGLE